MELLEQRCMLASDWQNPLWNLDVDDDGTLSPLDALVIINKINAADPNLDLRQPVGNNPYLDVDADLTLSPLDVLKIINRINLGQTSVQVDVSLRTDSGQSSSDRITNDSALVGQFTPLSGLTYTAKARINRGPVATITLDSNNKFIFNPKSIGAVADGDLVSKILIMASDGSVGPRHVPFTLNTTAPLITAAFKNDTGQSGTDRVTSDPTVSGSAIDDRQVVTLRAGFDSSQIQSYFDILTDLNADGSFTLSPTRLAQINAGQLSDGQHILHVQATDLVGNSASLDFSFKLLTQAPPAPEFDLSAGSTSPAIATTSTTESARVTLVGTTGPNVTVQLLNAGTTSLSSNNGFFQFPDVVVALGDNTFTAQATDAAGNISGQFQKVIHRNNSAGQQDPVLR